MIRRVSFLILCMLTAVLVDSGTLLLTVDDSNLVPLEWTYIDVTTRQWLPGCCWYDFLGCLLGQGCGNFNPTTFYSTYQPLATASKQYSFETDSGCWRALCGTELDEFNSLRLNYEADGIIYEGSFRVIPGGSSDQVNIQCQLVVGTLECGDPVVAWDNKGTAIVNISVV